MQFLNPKDSIPIPCPKHPTNSITFVCVSDKCKERLLCDKCVKEIADLDFHVLEKVSKAWELDLNKEMNQIQQLQSLDNKLYQEKLQEIEKAVDIIQQRILQTLKKAKEKILQSFPLIKVVSDENWDNIYGDFVQVASSFQQNPSTNNASKYLNQYIDFKRRINKLQKKREVLRSQTMFNYPQLEITVNGIERYIDHFQKSFYMQSEVQWQIDDVNLKNLKVDRYLEGPGDSLPRSIEFINDRNFLVIGDKLGHLSLWDAKKFVRYAKVKGHTGYINNLKYHSTRDWIISASSDGFIKVWQPSTGPSIRLIQQLKASPKYIWGILVLEKRGVMYSCGGEPDIKIWSLNKFKQIGKIDTGGKERMGRDIVLIEKYNVLVVGFQNGLIAFYDIDSKDEVATIQNASKVIISCILYLPKDDLLLAGTDLDGKIGIWKLKDDFYSYYPQPEFQFEIKIGGTYAEKIIPINKEQELLVATGSTSRINLVSLKKKTVKTLTNTKLEDCVGFALHSGEKKLVLGDYRSNTLAVLKY